MGKEKLRISGAMRNGTLEIAFGKSKNIYFTIDLYCNVKFLIYPLQKNKIKLPTV